MGEAPVPVYKLSIFVWWPGHATMAQSGSLSTSPGSQLGNIYTNFKEILKFLGSQVRLPATKIR